MATVYNDMDADTFCAYIEDTVKDTIQRFSLFSQKEKLLIAVSGGKDSQVLLYIVKQLGYQVDAFLIDEGIKGYREYTIADMQKLCDTLQVPLTITTYQQEYGFGVDEALKKKPMKPCTLCGTFRRSLLNKQAQKYDKLLTGHNLDDESQAIIMNICSHQLQILPRLGPINAMHRKSKIKGFTPRVKPLYFIKEKEIRLYAFLKKLQIYPGDCPYSPQSFRAIVQDWLNEYENKHQGTKRNIVEWFLKNYETLATSFSEESGAINYCKVSGEPCKGSISKTWELQQEISNISLPY